LAAVAEALGRSGCSEAAAVLREALNCAREFGGRWFRSRALTAVAKVLGSHILAIF